MKKLLKKYKTAQAKLARAQMVERELRQKVGDQLLPKTQGSKTILDGENKIAIKRQTGYTAPSAVIPRLKKKLSAETFLDLFYVNHSVRDAAYKRLAPKEKKLVDKFISVRPPTYQITFKEE